MKNRILFVLCAGMLAMSIFASGCGNKKAGKENGTEAVQEEVSASAATEAPLPPATETPTPPPIEGALPTIGTPAGDLYEGELTNATGKAIKKFQVKVSESEELGGNLLRDGELFQKKETRALYFEAPDEAAFVENPVYEVQLTFKDGSVAVLHAFPFGDMENAKIRMSDGTAYLVYDSISQKKTVDTLGSEQKVAQPEI